MKFKQWLLDFLGLATSHPLREWSSQEDTSKTSSLDIVFDLTRSQLDSQMARIDGLDTKAGLVLASASVLTGALATWRSPIIVGDLYPALDALVANTPLISILIYLCVAVTSAMALLMRKYEYPPHPSQLREFYLNEDIEYTKRRVRATMEEAYLENEKRIAWKVWWNLAAFVSLLIETLVVAVILILVTMFN